MIANAPKLFILNTPENQQLIQEMELLCWKESSTGVTMPVLDEYVDPTGHSDLSAALRYLIVSYVPTSHFDDSDIPNDTQWVQSL